MQQKTSESAGPPLHNVLFGETDSQERERDVSVSEKLHLNLFSILSFHHKLSQMYRLQVQYHFNSPFSPLLKMLMVKFGIVPLKFALLGLDNVFIKWSSWKRTVCMTRKTSYHNSHFYPKWQMSSEMKLFNEVRDVLTCLQSHFWNGSLCLSCI